MKIVWHDSDDDEQVKQQQEAPEAKVSFKLEEDAEALFNKAIRGDDFIKGAAANAPVGRYDRKHLHGRVIDLHGLGFAEAQDKVIADIIDAFAGSSEQQLTFRIVTGKGIHSGKSGPGVLATKVLRWFKQRYSEQITRIDSDLEPDPLFDLPRQGSFEVTMEREDR